MSMLSAQCDKLRERAKELRSLAPDPNVPYLVPSTKETMALAMRSAASEIEDAADTIWELRDKAQELQAENVRLRAERDHMWALRDTWQENDAKLRELVHLMARHDRVPSVDELDEWHDEAEEIRRRMRELGMDYG